MKHIGIFLIVALSLISCNKALTLDDIKVNIEGTWSEQYDPAVFAMDGATVYTFDGNNYYQLHTYDALSGESSDINGVYLIDLVDERNSILFNPFMSDFSGVTYNVVKLTNNEMAWQRLGTTYSKGTWGTDYRHFIRVK